MQTPAAWYEYFLANRDAVRVIDWSMPSGDTAVQQAKLARSLSHFQLGESGEGKRIRSLAAKRGTEYLGAVELFVKEENGHARLLAEAVAHLGGSLTLSHWTETFFVVLRRLLTLRVEVQVLAIAEIIGLEFYRMVRARTKDAGVAAMCDIFLREETKHLAFDADSIIYLAGRAPGPLFRVCARALFTGAICVAWIDHGPALRAFGYRFGDWLRGTLATYRAFALQRNGK